MPSPRAFATFSFVVLAVAAISASAIADDEKDYAAGELLVKFKSGYEGKGSAAINKLGAKVMEKLSTLDISRLNLPKNLNVKKAMDKFKALPFVEFAEPNYYFKPTWSTNDPRWEEQWGITEMEVPGAWGTETGKREVIIAIVDTGVDLDHPDLADKMLAGYDYVDMDSSPDDVGGHGTHCAGIAAASTNNGKGVAGVCANCSIMPLRVMGPSGGLASDVAKGVVWAVDHGANVISMSLGGMFPSSTQNDAIDYAWSKGAILIAAAGNSGVQDAHYPAYHSTCVAVASTEKGDSRSQFSNYGSWVDVAAPGSYIMSSVPGGGYEYKSGTSMATPMVAGLAGLIWSRLGSDATNQKVRDALENTCDSVGSWVANGRVNARRAVSSVQPPSNPDPGSGGGGGASQNPDPPPPTSKPSPSGTGYSPTGYGMDKGSTVESPSNSLVKSDDSLLLLRSTQSGKKRYLDFNVSSKVVRPAKVGTMKVVFEGRSYVESTDITGYFWNWMTKKWDWIARETLAVDDTTVTFKKKDAGAYVSGSGKVRFRANASSDWFATFELGADYTRFFVKKKKGSSSGGGSGSGGTGGEKPKDGDDEESLEKKAADALKKLTGW